MQVKPQQAGQAPSRGSFALFATGIERHRRSNRYWRSECSATQLSAAASTFEQLQLDPPALLALEPGFVITQGTGQLLHGRLSSRAAAGGSRRQAVAGRRPQQAIACPSAPCDAGRAVRHLPVFRHQHRRLVRAQGVRPCVPHALRRAGAGAQPALPAMPGEQRCYGAGDAGCACGFVGRTTHAQSGEIY